MQEQDRKANIPNPYGDWADAQGYERDEPGSNPFPELGSLKAQSKAGVGVFAPEDEPVSAYPQETTEATDTDAPCIFCGRVHGADSDPEEAGAGDPIAARTLEEKLQEIFGAIFPNAGVTVTNADEAFFSKEDLLVLNASLQLMASTILSVEAMREKRFDVAQGFASMSRKALDTAQSFVGSSTYALNTLGTMGERILDLAQDMNDGKTAGLVVAPF